MVTRLAILISLITLSVNAQTIHVTSQNVLDLNPERDALSGLVGSHRIKATFNDGSDPLDVTAGLPVALLIKSRVDDYQVSVLNSATNVPPDTVWWVVPFLDAV